MGLKRRMRKIRLSLDGEKGELTGLLNELQMWNLSLKHCFERTEIPPTESIRDRAVTVMHDQFDATTCDRATEDARILHEALTKNWDCTCAVPHDGGLRLKWHMAKMSANAQYEMAMSLEETTGRASAVGWKTIKMTVDSARFQSSTVALKTHRAPPTDALKSAKPNKKPKKVRIHEFLPSRTIESNDQSTTQAVCSSTSAASCTNTERRPTSRNMSPITTLCSSIAGCDDSNQDLGYLTYIKNSSTVQVHVQNTPTKLTNMSMAPVRTNQH